MNLKIKKTISILLATSLVFQSSSTIGVLDEIRNILEIRVNAEEVNKENLEYNPELTNEIKKRIDSEVFNMENESDVLWNEEDFHIKVSYFTSIDKGSKDDYGYNDIQYREPVIMGFSKIGKYKYEKITEKVKGKYYNEYNEYNYKGIPLQFPYFKEIQFIIFRKKDNNMEKIILKNPTRIEKMLFMNLMIAGIINISFLRLIYLH